ncbi:MAG: PSD1 domain-containing protein [Planctomycetes bacterium]|nr:PSD1 domain-containing protein [Planctomycetota bacterium]
MAPDESSAVQFNRDILPILSGKCFTCHGPDSSARKAKLRLDQRDAALKPARSGANPIVPGKADQSEVVGRIFAADQTERMPPAKSGKSLTEREKQLLRRWIDQGAEYQLHWAFVQPRRAAPPNVKNQAWVTNEIDRFILARLEAAGLEPSDRADPLTLIRRLSLDLRGLPPTLKEVDEFLIAWRDPTATPQVAWEQLVDRMLASPHHGEKMALLWLDLARYGDTSGYHMDSTRQMWLWRDWVIEAFNRNMPFDQFTIEQLAGDLLPKATVSQRTASGFNRNTRFNEEGGVDPEEYVIRYNVDRTNTVGQVWLGLTLGCAECHSHKYDPISHKDYYQLFAYFSGITEPMVEGPEAHGRPLTPILKVPSKEQEKSLAEHRLQLEKIEQALAREVARFKYRDPLEGKQIPAKVSAALIEQSQAAWETQGIADDQVPAEIRRVLKVMPEQRDEKQVAALRGYYLRKVFKGERDPIDLFEQECQDLQTKIKKIEYAVPHTLVTVEMKKPRPAHVLFRGDFQQKRERVYPGVPVALSPLPKNLPPNRLGLARWLVSAENPLTARVIVNRLWAQMFGQGIVRTLGDFGSQGDYPSHPELLDWLAVEFSGADSAPEKKTAWNVRHLLRTIALSATYRQSSVVRTDALKGDPHNRLLSHAPRYRLSAEEIRDGALAISGLLSKKVGGPSFMPYQPGTFYKFKNENWYWSASDGEEQYRRGLYAFWRRTALHPMFLTFDAPSREDCVVERARTNTPLQALVTLNDPTFVEAARGLAQRVLIDGPKDQDGRLAFAFRLATCRQPEPAELAILRHRLGQQAKRFRADPDTASHLVNVGQFPRDARLDVPELAAWTALCNILLNLDEVMTRE